jgi:hypothetical protein
MVIGIIVRRFGLMRSKAQGTRYKAQGARMKKGTRHKKCPR